MKAVFTILAASLILASCGGDAEATEEKSVELKNFKQRISYAMGADHAGQLVNSGDPNYDKYDKEQIIKGFAIGLENENAFDEACQATLEKLVGPSRQEFNAEYNKEGSLCIGKILGNVFVSGWKKNNAYDQFDIEFVKIGFTSALNETDTLIDKAERTRMVQDFITDINNKATAEGMAQEQPFFEKVKAMKGIQALPEGLYLETIKDGKGAKPGTSDDIMADYALTNIKGDSIESSFDGKKMGRTTPVFSLIEGDPRGVIRGWRLAFPFMKKGGKYRLYVPSALAYGKEPLVFYIELVEFGKPGTLK